jgi:two-component system, cell cycle sensor histidine kinase and response regulator CckA
VNILVVEDDAKTLALIDRLLTTRGHAVIAAHDPDDALVALAEDAFVPDLLLTDIVLPDRNGIDYARSLKATHPRLKIVFMTGWPHREPAALRSGLGPILRKPFTPEALYQVLEP